MYLGGNRRWVPLIIMFMCWFTRASEKKSREGDWVGSLSALQNPFFSLALFSPRTSLSERIEQPFHYLHTLH